MTRRAIGGVAMAVVALGLLLVHGWDGGSWRSDRTAPETGATARTGPRGGPGASLPDNPARMQVKSVVRSEPVVRIAAADPPEPVDPRTDPGGGVPLVVPRVPEGEITKPNAPVSPPPEGPEYSPPGGGGTPPEAPRQDAAPPAPGPLTSPVLLQAAWVPYPEAARKKKAEGIVEVRVRVDASGAVSTVDIVTAAADTSLNRAARESALSMRFRPAMQDGRPVEVWYNYRFDFKLPRS